MCLTTDVTKKNREDYGHPPREGAYVFGLFMEGKFLLELFTNTDLADKKCLIKYKVGGRFS